MTDNWNAWRYLSGQWESDPANDLSQGAVKFSFRFDPGENILIRENRSILPAVEASTENIHEDLMVVYSEGPCLKRAIYFDNEQHVIHYQANISEDNKTIVLESEATAVTPLFRFTYIRIDEDTLNAKFEIAPAGNPGQFSVYLEGKARKTGTA
jgi:hypothetical protein